MTWFLLFLGLALATLAGLLTGSGALVCKILAVVVFAIGAILAILPLSA